MDDLNLARKTVALVAHDNCKSDLVEWVEYNMSELRGHRLVATGTTGAILEHELGLHVERLQSGPLGGDLQIGARITEGGIDALIFFWDPLEPQPHDPDVKALLRIAVVWNIPVACNRSSADYMVSSPLMSNNYQRRIPTYDVGAVTMTHASQKPAWRLHQHSAEHQPGSEQEGSTRTTG